MVYINAMRGSLLALSVFILLVLFLPVQPAPDQVTVVLTVSTFLFAILAGLFITRLNSRYINLRDLVALEDASFLALYKTSTCINKQFSNKIRDIIDRYYIRALEIEFGFWYKQTAKQFLALYEEIGKLNIKNFRQQGALDEIFDLLTQLEEVRNKTVTVAQEKLTKGQWSVLIFLALIMIISIFSLKVNEFYSQLTTVLLSTIMALVLLIIRDLQKLRLFTSELLVESGEEVLEYIGKLRYYNQTHIKNGDIKIPEYVKKYRLGLHEPGEKIRLKTVIVKKGRN